MPAFLLAKIADKFRSLFSSAPRRRSRQRFQDPWRRPNAAAEIVEDRVVLSAVSFDAGTLQFDADANETDDVSVSSPDANTLVIDVGDLDTISLQGGALGNPNFQLSDGDTVLTVNVAGAGLTDALINLGDQNDSLSVNSLPTGVAFTANGEAGNDTLDATGADENVVLIGGSGGDTLLGGLGDDILAGGGGTDIIDGGEGNDTNSFAGIGVGVTANVNADGTGTAVYGAVNEVFTGIENLTGSDNDDVLSATGAAANILLGGLGDDILAGGGGTDIIDGGEGNDTNSFAGIGVGVTANVNADGSGTAVYGAVNEVFAGIENLTGSDNDDVLTATGAAANILLGGFGDDILAGGGGTDIIDGGEGNDTNSFAGIGVGVTANVNADGTGTAVYGAVNEVFAGIENLTGSDNDDVLTATGAAANILLGGLGDDILAGGGGTDIIDGGEGNDTNSFAGIGVGVTANVNADGTGTAVYGAVNEVFAGIENLTGSDNDDVLTATGAAANILLGGLGDDILAGGGGTDIIDGGEGNDTNSFAGIGVGVTANVNADGTGTAVYGAVNEVFAGIENLTGSDNDDVLTATGAAANILLGGLGDDILAGGGGTDIIDGGEGNDTNSFAGIGVGVTANVNADGTGTAVYGAVNEVFTGIENLTGSDNDDVLTATGAAANILLGGLGDDILAGGGGTDIIDGGEGNDTNSFAGIGVGVTANVNADGTGTAVYGAVNEVFTGIENLTGSDNDDVLTATGAAANILLGGLGDDILAGGGGTDIIDGGEGNDTNSFAGIGVGVTANVNADGTGTAVYGAVNEVFTGIENLTGSDNDDVLTATGAAANILLGGLGDDILAGGGGTDIIDGGEGNDTNSFAGIGVGVTANVNADGTGTAVYGAVNEVFTGIENLTGSDNADTLSSTGDAVNVLQGAAGDDFLTGGPNAILLGGEGNDATQIDFGNETVFLDVFTSGDAIQLFERLSGFRRSVSGFEQLIIDSGIGNDVFRIRNLAAAGLQQLTVNAGNGNNFVNAFLTDVSARVTTGNGADVVWTGTADDEIDTGVGADTIFSNSGDDLILAGNGNNRIFAGLGNDTVTAGNGNDLIRGDGGNDIIDAGGGNNRVFGDAGDDTITTGTGNDFVTAGTGNDVIDVGAGNDNVTGGSGDDTIFGGSGNDFLVGNSGDDLIQGGSGNDRLIGNSGNDILLGNGGRDLLIGNSGRDLLFGGAGIDSLFGGTGQDILHAAETQLTNAQLKDVRTEWTSPRTYDQRIDNIVSGTGTADRQNGSAFINATTSTNDGSPDFLFGQGDLDAFFASIGDLSIRGLNERLFSL